MIFASAEGKYLAGGKQQIVPAAFRDDMADVPQIYDITVITAKKHAFWKFFDDRGNLSGFANGSLQVMKNKFTVVGFDKTAFC